MPKQDLVFKTPYLNAAGMLGFAPRWTREETFLDSLGAFVTNPVSLAPRQPAEERAMLSFAGGFLLHSGLPNPGLRRVIQHYAGRWASAPLPVIVHALVNGPKDLVRFVERLVGLENVIGIEVGLAPEIEVDVVVDLVQSAAGELPLVLCLPLERAVEIGRALVGSEVSAVSLAPARGVLPGDMGRLLRGRMYGPALFPQALAAVQALSKMGLPVIGAGGIYRQADAAVMLSAGALAVQLDTILWWVGVEDFFFTAPARS